MSKSVKIKESFGDRVFNITLFIVLTTAMLVVLFPLYFIVIASISDPVLVQSGEVLFWPKGITFEGYKMIFQDSSIWRGYGISLWCVVVGTIINLIFTIPAGYALSRKDLPGKKFFMLFLTFTMFFGGGLIPTYLLVKDLGLINSLWSLVLTDAVSVINIIIVRTYFQTNIPEELYEAAQMDGCSEVKTFFKIAIPLAKPIIAIMVLYYGLGQWNQFFKGIIYIQDENLYPYRYQYFLFDRHKDLNMLFTPGKHELDVMVNQTPLHSDQFEEITIYDLYGQDLPQSVIDAAGIHFGWTYAELEKYSGEYENTGIGFKLVQPLDADLAEEENGAMDLYVEASVQRRVNDGPLKRKLQRTATFVYEKTVDVEGNGVVDIEDAYYLYGENQLEVFSNGKRLDRGIHFIEGTDLSDQDDIDEEGNITALAPRRKGAKTKQFTITNPNPITITYKITTSIYSYDHVNQLIDELDYNALTAVKKVDELYDKTVDIQNRVQATIEDLSEELEEIKDIANNLDGKYLTKDTVISISQMPPIMVSNMVQSLNHISSSITFNAGKTEYSIKTDVREEDFVMAIKRDVTNQLDKFFIRGVDYSIYNTVNQEGAYEDTILSISSSAAALMNTGDIIILTGIKFGKAGRE